MYKLYELTGNIFQNFALILLRLYIKIEDKKAEIAKAKGKDYMLPIGSIDILFEKRWDTGRDSELEIITA